MRLCRRNQEMARDGKQYFLFAFKCDLAVLGGETLFAKLLFQLLLFFQDSFMLLLNTIFKKIMFALSVVFQAGALKVYAESL